MKSKTVKKTISSLVLIALFVSVFAMTAGAEELLPEAYGTEMYCDAIESETTAVANDESNEAAEVVLSEDQANEQETVEQNTLTTESSDAFDEVNESTAEGTDFAPIVENKDEKIIPVTEEENPQQQETEETIATESEDIESSTSVEEDNQENANEQETSDVTAKPENEVENVTDAVDGSSGLVGTVAGIGTVATAIPHHHNREPEEDVIIGENGKIRETAGNVIIKIGESLLPFGNTISNFIRSRSHQADNMDGVETAIDAIADTASFSFPIAAPIVSVAKDIVLKIWNLF